MLETINFLLTTFVLKIDVAYTKLLQLLSYGRIFSFNKQLWLKRWLQIGE